MTEFLNVNDQELDSDLFLYEIDRPTVSVNIARIEIRQSGKSFWHGLTKKHAIQLRNDLDMIIKRAV